MLENYMNTSVKIIGIGGLPRSGKDSLADFFMKSGFFGVSLGDIVRDQARERHADKPDPISVRNMTETSNWLRSEHGADFALQEAQERFKAAFLANPNLKGLVVFSVRAPAEVDYILENKGELIWVEAADEIRHQRALDNLRDGETPLSFEEFKQQEALQWTPQEGLPVEAQMNTEYVKHRATRQFENNLGLAEFESQAQKLVAELEG